MVELCSTQMTGTDSHTTMIDGTGCCWMGSFAPKSFNFLEQTHSRVLEIQHFPPLNFKFFICIVNVDIKANDMKYQNQSKSLYSSS